MSLREPGCVDVMAFKTKSVIQENKDRNNVCSPPRRSSCLLTKSVIQENKDRNT